MRNIFLPLFWLGCLWPVAPDGILSQPALAVTTPDEPREVTAGFRGASIPLSANAVQAPIPPAIPAPLPPAVSMSQFSAAQPVRGTGTTAPPGGAAGIPAESGKTERADAVAADAGTAAAAQTERRQAVPPDLKELELQQRGIVRVEVRPAKPYLLSLPFPGTLLSLEARDGELVVKDQVLAVLDKQNAERELEEARLAMKSALERVQSLQGRGLGAQEGAREQLARSADKLRDAEERLAMTTLRAPFDGRVAEIKARAGQHLRRGEAVMELTEQGDLEIISQVPSGWVSRLRPGNLIWVYVEETGKSYEAEFVRFGGKVSPSVHSIRAYARFVSTPAELLPGMSGRADFFPPLAK